MSEVGGTRLCAGSREHTLHSLYGRITMVVGARRGIGYGIVTAFIGVGDRVVLAQDSA